MYAERKTLHPLPVAVRLWTQAYEADEDKLDAFVADRVIYARDASVTVGALFTEYEEWCRVADVPAADRLRMKGFAKLFVERGHGVARRRDSTNRVIFTGARVR